MNTVTATSDRVSLYYREGSSDKVYQAAIEPAGRKLVIQPEDAAIRRKAYELFLENRRKGQVARLLNAAGYRSRNGSIWRDTQVFRTLVCPSAKGIYYFNRVRQTGTWKTEPKPESEWGSVEWA